MSRILTFEWRRAVSLRSTWGFPGLGIALLLFICWAPMIFADNITVDGQPFQATLNDVAANTANPLGLVLITTLCAQAFGHEYRDGTMRLVLSEFPVRPRVFTAKLIVPALFVLVSVLIAQVIAIAVAVLFFHLEPATTWGAVIALAGRQLALALWWGLIVAAITALLRNLAAGIVVAIAAAAVLEPLLSALLGSRVPALVKGLPFSSATQWASDAGGQAGTVALVWVAVLVGLAGVLFVRRDA